MFVRNFLTAGSYVTLMPIGADIIIQYNEKGMIEKIYDWHKDVDITDKLLNVFLETDIVPRKLPIQDGTSWVNGSLVATGYISEKSGELPNCVTEDYLDQFLRHPEKFKFYACDISSNAIKFMAILSNRQWLVSNKFETLPGFLVPAEVNEDSFLHMCETNGNKFGFPRISGYYVYANEGTYYSLDFKQFKVSKITQSSDPFGRIIGTLHLSGNKTLNVDYSELIKHDIRIEDLLLCDEHDEIIISTHTPTSYSSSHSRQFPCPTCGRPIIAQPGKVTQCEDSHCNSRLFRPTDQFLTVLKLPGFKSYEDFKIYSSQFGVDFEVPDVLKDVRLEDKLPVTVSIATALRAIIPYSVVSFENTQFINAFCNRCNNVNSTIEYYLSHPDKLAQSDLFTGLTINPLVMWLSDRQNIANVHNVLHSEYITIIQIERKFEGAPIFRSNTFAITGKFLHGSYSDIVSILQSYSATVVSEYTEGLTGLIVGDMGEDIDGHLVKLCRFNRIPVYTETQFFEEYEIDKDLVENLK